MNHPTPRSIWDNLNNSKLVRYLLLFALAWATIQVLAYFETVVVIFIFSAIFAFLLSFPTRWAARIMPRGIAAVLVFLLSLLILLGIVATLGIAAFSQAQQLVDQAPDLLNGAIGLLDDLQALLQRINLNVDLSQIEDQLRDQALATLGMGFTTLQSVLVNTLDLIVIAVVTLFMLLDGKRLWDFLLKLFPRGMRDRITEAIQKNLLGFFWGRFLLSVFFGVSVYLVFILLDVPYALGLAAIAGMFDLIPGIGATIGISIISLIILPQGIGLALTVLISCILLQQVEENLLMPRIMQGSINMNPVVMFFALLVGARVAGLVGVFLSVPIAGVLISLFEVEEMQGKH